MSMNPHRTQSRSRLFAQIAGIAAVLLGGGALLGWWLNNEMLKSIVPGSSPLKPNIAAGILLCGGALVFLSLTRSSKPARVCAALGGISVILLGGLTLGEHFLGWNLGIDGWLVPPGANRTSQMLRMAPATALCFFLTGIVFFAQSHLAPSRLNIPLAAGLSVALVFIGGLALAGFLLEMLFGPGWNLMGMSVSGVTASVGFLLLGGGVLALLRRSEHRLVWSLDNLTMAGFALGILLMVVAAAMAFNYSKRMLETTTWLTHRQEVLQKVQEVLTDVTNLLSQERLYVILGDETFLKGREETRLEVMKDLFDVRKLTADNPNQQRRLDRLESLIAQRIDWEEKIIAARREQGFPAAAQMISTGPGMRLSDEAFGLIQELQDEEHALLARDKKQAEAASITAFSLLPVGMFLSMAVLSLGVAFLNSGITEQKQAEGALRASEKRYRELFESNPNPMWVYDDETLAFLAVNVAALRHYGFSEKEFLAMTIKDIRPEEDLPALMENVAQAHGELDETTEWRHRKKNGELIDVEITSHEVRWLGRRARLVLINDVTARKRAELEIQQLNAELEDRVERRTAELESANKELEAFSYSVSHDLRSPLRTVDGFSQAVLEDYGPQIPVEGRRYLQTIRDGAQRMGVLIDDLLTFSRLSRLPLHKENVDLTRMVRDTFAELDSEKEGRKIELKIGVLPKVHGDPALLKQVWLNLLSNAMKYTRKRELAVIEVGSKQENGSAICFVSDNGTGFDMQYAHKLFGVFQRLHRTDEFEGTGVGLAIVQRVIHRHGGRVWADAAEGKGATFYFTLDDGSNKL